MKTNEMIDDAGKVRYVGRTRQKIEVRQKQHWKADPAKKGLDIRVAEYKGKELKGLSYSEARGLEQKVFEKYGGLKKLMNKIKPLDVGNAKIKKKVSDYLEAAEKFLKNIK